MEHFPYKLASPMLQLVTKELGRVLKDKTLEIWQVDDKLRELQATYLRIESMLGKFDCWEVNPTLEPWLLDLDRYCYDTEDLVDDLTLSRRPATQEKDENPSQNPVRLYIFKSGRLGIGGQIGELQKKLNELASLIEKLLPTQTHDVSREQPSVPFTGRSLLLDKTPLAPGTTRDQDKQKIIQKLGDSCGVSIIGMDGLGKTALARSILVDPAIKDHFPLVLSASVSGHFQMEQIIKELVADHLKRKSTRAESYEIDDADIILQKLLCSQRSLIVLDDMWSVTDEDWDFFVCNYLNSRQDWRALITTRNPKVAEVTGTSLFYLNKMTEDDCKKLIIHKARLSAVESERWSSDIDVIASKCKGMPVIANKFGLKLSKKHMVQLKTTIVEFKMTELSSLQEFREVFPSLNLNKPKLPPYLKRCLAYFSLFPPNHEFNKDELIQLWEAEGFIQPQQTMSSKQALNQCFDDLLSRSILQPLESIDNNQPVYRMHELNHEFAQLIASKAFRKVDDGTPNLLSACENIRHLSLISQNTDEPLLKKIERCKGLRTFLLLHQKEPKIRSISCSFFHKLHSLRLLDLSHTNISKFPKPISPSKHLRYLDLSYTGVKRLPEPIRFLRALQILKLKGCSKLLQLPKDLNQLISLTHLHVDMKTLRDKLSNIGMLTRLEVLDSFLVGKNKGYSLLELKNMKHLREIRISSLENIKDKEEAHKIMLSEKLWLRRLVLEWDNRLAAKVTNASDVLEGLQPHNHLEDLTVRNYGGQKFPTWLVTPSCQLVSIYLDNCPNCQVLPSLGQLELLKNLVVRSVHSVRSLDSQFHGQGKRRFPCLQSLEFRDMKGLVNWIGLKEGDMPRLRALKTIGCPILDNLPSFEHLGHLINIEINNCPILQSLPKLPSSLNGEAGELIIMHADLVTQRCQAGGDNWAAIKDIPYVEIDSTRILTKTSSQPLENDKDEVSMNAHQPSTFTKLVKESVVSRVHQDEVTRSQQHPTTLPIRGDETQTSKEGEQDPCTLQNHNEIQRVKGELSKKKHHSSKQPDTADESCTSQHEEPRSKQSLPAALRLVDEILLLDTLSDEDIKI